MRFLFLFFFHFLVSLTCFSQDNISIIGKWKVVAITSEDYYHNFDKDSTVLSIMFKEKLIENKKDTLRALRFIKVSTQIFKNAFYIFKPDSTYQNIFGDTSIEEGKFNIDLVNKRLLTFSLGDNDIKKEQTYHFYINENKLKLTMASGNEDVIIYLEKF